MKKAVDDNKIFSAIFIELSKTFDCICPRLPPELKTKNQNWIFIQYVGENYFWCSSIAQRSILFNNFYRTYFWNMKVIVSIITQAILINNKLKFELHVGNRKWIVNKSLNALARLTNHMELHRMRILMNEFLKAQFNYCPIVLSFTLVPWIIKLIEFMNVVRESFIMRNV